MLPRRGKRNPRVYATPTQTATSQLSAHSVKTTSLVNANDGESLMANKALPPMTTMMLDVLTKTLRTHENTRAAAVCRCVFTVYSMTHGDRPPWEIMGVEPEVAQERVKAQPVTIVDTTAEVISEETRIYEEDRGTGARPVEVSSVRRPGGVSRPNGKRMRSPNHSSRG